jgi:hypothetical protein
MQECTSTVAMLHGQGTQKITYMDPLAVIEERPINHLDHVVDQGIGLLKQVVEVHGSPNLAA